jgi:predicted Fe-S protein YdhL (DUF1289 family)
MAISTPTAVPSPCVDVCRLDEARGVCDGCLRTLDEIAAWGSLDDAGKLRIWALLDARRAALASSTVPIAADAAGSTGSADAAAPAEAAR